jgi:hypothetical protein
MTLKEKINADYMTAFKAKDVVSKKLLSVIKGEIQTIEKNVGVDSLSDEEGKFEIALSKSLPDTLIFTANKYLSDTLEVTENDMIPALLIIEGDDEKYGSFLYAPDRDYNDLNEAVSIIKGHQTKLGLI